MCIRDSLDELAKTRTVVAPSLPGYPGATGHTVLDTHLDWVLATRQLLDKAGLADADLVGASVGGAFAAEMAAIFPERVGRLVLIAPFGLFDEAEPAADPWAQRKDMLPGLMCADAAKWQELVAPPDGANSIEWPIEMSRASEAAARASSNARSRSLRVIAAARANSRLASSVRPSFFNRSPRTLGSRW